MVLRLSKTNVVKKILNNNEYIVEKTGTWKTVEETVEELYIS